MCARVRVQVLDGGYYREKPAYLSFRDHRLHNNPQALHSLLLEPFVDVQLKVMPAEGSSSSSQAAAAYSEAPCVRLHLHVDVVGAKRKAACFYCNLICMNIDQVRCASAATSSA